MLSDRDLIELFREYGAEDDVGRLEEVSGDEAIFIISREDLLRTRNRDLTIKLQAVLGKKVWVVTEGSLFENPVEWLRE